MVTSTPTPASSELLNHIGGLVVWAYIFSIGFSSIFIYQRVSKDLTSIQTKQLVPLSLASGGLSVSVGVIIYYSLPNYPPSIALSTAVIFSIGFAAGKGLVIGYLRKPDEAKSVTLGHPWRDYVEHHNLESESKSASILMNDGKKISGEIHQVEHIDEGVPDIILETGAVLEGTDSNVGSAHTVEVDGQAYIQGDSITSIWIVDD